MTGYYDIGPNTTKILSSWKAIPKSFILILLFFCICLPAAINTYRGLGGLAGDSIAYHIPQINEFVKSPFNFVSYYPTAPTLPFYHAFMGWIAITFGISEVSNETLLIRVLHFSVSSLGIIAFSMYLSLNTTMRNMLILGFPLITSWYVTSGATFLGTDGPGLTLVIFSLLLCSNYSGAQVLQAVILFLIAGTRHMMLPYAVSALLFNYRRINGGGYVRFLICLFPASVLVLLYFYYWGRLTPPGFVADLNPGGIFMYNLLGHLAVVGLWGIGFGFVRLDKWRGLIFIRNVQNAFVITSVLVFFVWVLSPTNYSITQGRFGSIAWTLSDIATLWNRSFIILILSIIGTYTIILCLFDSRENDVFPVEIMSLCVFLFALTMTHAGYQRYIEPVCILSFSLFFCRIFNNDSIVFWRALPLLSLTGVGFYTSFRRLLWPFLNILL